MAYFYTATYRRSRGATWPSFAPALIIVPERIRDNRQPYYEALRAADRAWDDGHFDVSQLAAYLSDLLKAQLADAP